MKKLLTILSGISIISAPVSYVTSCYSPPKDDLDYYIPELSDQPKSIEEIIELAGNAKDNFEKYKILSYKEWENYRKSIDDWNKLPPEEIQKHRINFNINSTNSQKEWIYQVWGITYNYKVYQFDNKYIEELKSPNEYTYTLEAWNLERYKSNINSFLGNEYISSDTKEHIKKIQTWAIQENPNVNK